MPAFVLGTGVAGVMMRHTRGAMLSVLGADYVRTARAKSLPERTVILKHALRNALIPVITLGRSSSGASSRGPSSPSRSSPSPGSASSWWTVCSTATTRWCRGGAGLGHALRAAQSCADILYFLANPRLRG